VGMVDVTGKFSVQREAEALGRIRLRADTLRAINEKKMEKGDVIEAAKIAAMMAVKNTPLILPHCHPLSITGVDVDVGPVEDGVEVLVRVPARGWRWRRFAGSWPGFCVSGTW